ncbi:tRNA G18 (ribose-2'-O)-methylase SpoU [Sphingomonas jinjuensis]|uniref:tRNA G18 (Ribose-2'-O)-methylase SpoU n=1 Tax=Sphingomonas jinjuensis TaxID=535907 RepID=A0A840F217_9SPHN|nr:RNA methyltransferase [Sphingomonas jinjuensis]MBB4153393.1 tRNA G18 (ribose-2'-O)-methylase SpoU [Sphingomonas jinjuensis]
MPQIVPILDPADPRIADYRDIRERDLVGRRGLFVAEGRVVLNVLVTSPRCTPVSLLVAEHRLPTLDDILDRLGDAVPVYAAAQPVLDAIAGFPLHRGLLALGRRTDTPEADALLAGLPADDDVLLLSAIANHDNMGGLFRNAAAFGVGAVLLDADCCDPLYRKAIRVSVGAALRVPYAVLPRDIDALALLERHGFAPLALSPAGAQELADLAPPPRAAVILGAEGPGLSPALLARTTSVRIDMEAGFDSLNVATTGGIVLHHLAAARRARNAIAHPAL